MKKKMIKFNNNYDKVKFPKLIKIEIEDNFLN
jgi:hypothetical protein